MRLTKEQREQVRMRCGGRCAYCGEPLGARWHADHLEPVQRKLVRDEAGRVRCGTEVWAPERDTIENLMPACQPCNNYKHSFDLETFRRMVAGTPDVLERNSSTYRHAVRFGLVRQEVMPVAFYFERLASQGGGNG